MTLKEFLDATCWTDFSQFTAKLICATLLAAEPHQVSLLAFLWYVASGQGLDRLINITNGAQERKFVGGAMQLSERMADGLKDKVKLSSPVVRVEQVDTSLARIYTSSGDIITASYVISAMPLALLNRVSFVPPLPPLKLQLIQRVPMGSAIKAITFYERAYWREQGLSGQMATDSGPVLYCMDDTKPDGSSPAIMGFILADRAVEFCGLSVDQRKKALAKHYAEVFRCPELLHPTNYIEKNWMEEEYSGGCYVSNFPPGTLTEFGPVMRQPHLKMYFAGTETATCWAGYMDGAIEAGERAAREVLHAEGKITAVQVYQNEAPQEDFPERGFEKMYIEKVLPSVPTFLVMLISGAVAVSGWVLHCYFN